MAENDQQPHNGSVVETTDCDMFDFMKRKDHEENIVAEAEKQKEEKHSLMDKLHSSDTHSSSSSSDEEEGEGNREKKKKKKKKKKDTAASGYVVDVDQHKESVPVAVENYKVEEKKGSFLDKIKEKLPGNHKNTAEEAPPGVSTTTHGHEGELGDGEHKGFLDKIKDKIPGYGHKD